jgi:uridine kinase
VFDVRTDSPLNEPRRRAADGAVLLFDGVFLLRPELRGAWDLSIFVRVERDETLRRALVRDVGLLGSAEEVERRYRARYLPGQQLYLQDARPLDHADFVVDNDDPEKPILSAR